MLPDDDDDELSLDDWDEAEHEAQIEVLKKAQACSEKGESFFYQYTRGDHWGARIVARCAEEELLRWSRGYGDMSEYEITEKGRKFLRGEIE